MTLVVGMACIDRMIFFADREENSEYGGKRSVSKLYSASEKGKWNMAIATAGSASIGDVATKQIIRASKGKPDFVNKADVLVNEILEQIHKKYIFPFDARKQQERGITLVIGIVDRISKKKLIFKTFEEIVKEEDCGYACAGSGQEIAHYFIDNFHLELSNGDEAERFLAFVMKEAKASTGGVGKETEIVKFDDDGTESRTLMGQVVEGIEIPSITDCMGHFWKEKPSP